MSAESQAVFNLFAGTVNPTPSVREEAENQLKQVKNLKRLFRIFYTLLLF